MPMDANRFYSPFISNAQRLPNGNTLGSSQDRLYEVTPEGELLTGSKLLWPQTEAVKAFAAQAEFFGDRNARALAEGHVALLFEHFLSAETGSWRNQIRRDGTVLDATAPTRILYHVMVGLVEVSRVFEE